MEALRVPVVVKTNGHDVSILLILKDFKRNRDILIVVEIIP
jgi:hypothetical protein